MEGRWSRLEAAPTDGYALRAAQADLVRMTEGWKPLLRSGEAREPARPICLEWQHNRQCYPSRSDEEAADLDGSNTYERLPPAVLPSSGDC